MAKLSDLSQLSELLSADEKTTLGAEEAKRKRAKPIGEGHAVTLFIDRKRRRGKVVTVIAGIHLPRQVAEQLAKDLKQMCGAGGTIQEAEIEIQGEHIPKIMRKLQDLGFEVKAS